MAHIERLKFTVKQRVTDKLIKLIRDVEYFVKFDSAFYIAKDNNASDPKPGEAVKQPPTLARVTMLDNGEQGVIIIPQLLRSDLNDAYPDAGYVNKSFLIVMHKLEGKKYNTFEIAEIETDGEIELVEYPDDDVEEATPAPQTRSRRQRGA